MSKFIFSFSLLFAFISVSSRSLCNDLGVIGSSSENMVECAGSSINIWADIENFGISTIDSFSIIIEVNGVPLDTVYIVQTIISGQQINQLVGNYSLFNNPIDSITLLTYLPNGVADQNNANDDYSFSLFSRLNGPYSVGCPSCDFQTINSSIDHLNDYGVCGPTELNIVDGYYDYTLVSPFVITPFYGMSSLNPVIIQSQSQDSTAVTLSPGASPSFQLGSVSNVTFQYLKFQLPSNSWTALYIGELHNVGIKNCFFVNSKISTVNTTSQIFDSLFIQNNRFLNSRLLLSSNYYFNNGAGFIENNEFINSDAIFTKLQFLNITGNHLNSPNIGNPLVLSYCSNFTIAKNFIESGVVGLSIDHADVGTNIIKNNFLRADSYVIDMDFCDPIDVINNSFYQYDNSNNGNEVFYSHASQNGAFYNNIFYSEDYGGLIHIQDTLTWNPHHNIYYNNSDLFLSFGSIPQPINYNDWTNIYGKDTASYYLNPYYNSPTDLHLTNLVVAEGNAYTSAQITDDFDNDPRNPNIYDIGADEFELDSTLRDLAMISIIEPDTNSCSASDSIRFYVANYSAFTIDSFTVKRYFFNNYVDSIWIIQSIQSGDTALVNAGAFNFVPNTLYDITLILDLPNGLNDNYELNNSDHVLYQHLAPPNITVNNVSDCTSQLELSVPHQLLDSLLWSTGEMSEMITVSPPGTWSVSITDSLGCISTGLITVN